MLRASFKQISAWDSGYTGSYQVVNHSGQSPADAWELTFELDSSATLADGWAEPWESSRLTDHGGGRYSIASTRPLAAGATAKFTMRVEPAGHPHALPHDCKIDGEPCAGAPDPNPPTAPRDLRLVNATARSLVVEWQESTDDVAVDHYTVYRDGAEYLRLPAPASSGVIAELTPETEYRLTLTAVDLAGNESEPSNELVARTTPTTAPPVGEPWDVPVAPFVDFTLWPIADLTEFRSESHCDSLVCAFVVAVPGEERCIPAWGGYGSYYITHKQDGPGGEWVPVDEPWEKANMDAYRAAGGVPIISFGGASSGSDIALVAKDVEQAYIAYKGTIDAYGVRHVDFDIEGLVELDKPSLARRSAAVARIQREYPDLKVSVTVPVWTDGMHHGVTTVQSFIDAGVKISLVNIMAMELPVDGGDLGMMVHQAATETHRQLLDIFPDIDEQTAWKLLGICPMYGKNNNGLVFTLDHTRALLEYAKAHGVGMLTAWEATRDKNACFGETYRCTSVEQRPWDFSRILARFEAERRVLAGSATIGA